MKIQLQCSAAPSPFLLWQINTISFSTQAAFHYSSDTLIFLPFSIESTGLYRRNSAVTSMANLGIGWIWGEEWGIEGQIKEIRIALTRTNSQLRTQSVARSKQTRTDKQISPKIGIFTAEQDCRSPRVRHRATKPWLSLPYSSLGSDNVAPPDTMRERHPWKMTCFMEIGVQFGFLMQFSDFLP